MPIRSDLVWKMRSLGWLLQAFPGIVFYTAIMAGTAVGTAPVLAGESLSQDVSSYPLRRVAPDMVLAPETTLRGAAGELCIFLDDPPQALTPDAWHIPAAGVVACSTEAKKCRFQFRFHQSKTGGTPESGKIGIVDVLVSNTGAAKSTALLWVAWRYGYSLSAHARGVLLGTETESVSEEYTAEDNIWNPASTWYFSNGGFVGNSGILYQVTRAEGWQRETWVRRPSRPYRDLTEQSVLGYTQFRRELEPKTQATIRIAVPYRPLPLSQRESLATITPLSE